MTLIRLTEGLTAELDSEQIDYSSIACEVQKHWESLLAKNPSLWNDPLLMCQEEDINLQDTHLDARIGDYSLFCYLVHNSQAFSDLPFRSLAAVAFLYTSDGYCILGRMSQRTSSPNQLLAIGGAVDLSDVHSQRVDFDGCIQREITEELGISPDSITLLEQKYLYITPSEPRLNVIYSGNIKQDSVEIIRHFGDYAAKEQGELEDITLIRPSEHKKILCDKQVPKYVWAVFNDIQS
jgi:8-oxo-dGTP pyrophosphatase MutT (NUDIX family)